MNFHGGIDTGSYLDFSVNVPAVALPKEAMPYLAKALENVHLYPSIDQASLCERIRQILHAEILICAGATQLIYAAARLLIGKTALIVEPTFTEYEAALKRSEILKYDLLSKPRSADPNLGTKHTDRGDYEAKADDLIRVIRENGVDAVFFCNPNNPVGYYLEDLVLRILENTDVLLVVDESFIAFVDGIDMTRHHEKTAMLIRTFPDRLLVIRSLTKQYSVPGFRIGYACASGGVIAKLREEIEPWSVGAVGAAFIEYLLDRNVFLQRHVGDYKELRTDLIRKISALGFRADADAFSSADCSEHFRSRVNYFVFQAFRGLNPKLREYGINIRTCADFEGLDDTYYRIRVRNAEDHRCLIDALKKIASRDREIPNHPF